MVLLSTCVFKLGLLLSEILRGRRDRTAELLGLVPEAGPSTPADALPVEPAFVVFALVKIGQTFGKAFDPGDPFGHKMGTKLPRVFSTNC